jgi:hypothetical protein
MNNRMPPTDILQMEDGMSVSCFTNSYGHYGKDKFNLNFFGYFPTRQELEASIIAKHGAITRRINKETEEK